MSRVLTGVDIDTEAVANELRDLADAIDRGDAPLERVATSDEAAVEDVAKRTVELRFVLTNGVEADLGCITFREVE